MAELIGHTTCPECGDNNAEVKRDKSGNPYRWCTSAVCNAQYFTRGHPDRARDLLSKTRLLEGQPPAINPDKVTAPPGPDDKKSDPPPSPRRPVSSWLSPLIGADHE